MKMKCSPFNQGIIQQSIMSSNKVITHMTELSDPPSYVALLVKEPVTNATLDLYQIAARRYKILN